MRVTLRIQDNDLQRVVRAAQRLAKARAAGEQRELVAAQADSDAVRSDVMHAILLELVLQARARRLPDPALATELIDWDNAVSEQLSRRAS